MTINPYTDMPLLKCLEPIAHPRVPGRTSYCCSVCGKNYHDYRLPEMPSSFSERMTWARRLAEQWPNGRYPGIGEWFHTRRSLLWQMRVAKMEGFVLEHQGCEEEYRHIANYHQEDESRRDWPDVVVTVED